MVKKMGQGKSKAESKANAATANQDKGNPTESTEKITINENDWMAWAEDPEPFQAALNGTKMPEISQADGHHYTDEEIDRIKKVGPEIQRIAESSTVPEKVLYRGEVYDSLAEAQNKYKVGATVTNNKLTSYATSADIAETYAGANIDFMPRGSVKVVIENTNVSKKKGSVGVKTDPLGAGGSYEVISPKGMESKVYAVAYDKGANTLRVRMSNSAVAMKKRK